jgi:hypothetical protein
LKEECGNSIRLLRLSHFFLLSHSSFRSSSPDTGRTSASDSGEMTDLVALLTFPSVSDGFSALHSAIRDSYTTWPSLPLSKVARLDADSDSASASRSRAGAHPTSRAVVARGLVRVSVSGSVRECPHLLELFQAAEYDHCPRATVYRTPNRWVARPPGALHAHNSHTRCHRRTSPHV